MAAENTKASKTVLTAPAAPRYIQITVQGDEPTLRDAIEASGGRVGTQLGDIATARVPLASLRGLAAHPAVRRVEHVQGLRPSSDEATRQVGGAAVQQGQPALPRGYTGEGVIVGIIDSGIDFRHLDFRRADDPRQSRILAIWDQTVDNSTPPSGFDYGSEWTRAQIEAALRGDRALRGHGAGGRVSGGSEHH